MKILTLTTGLFASVLAWTIALPAQAYEAGPVTGGGTIVGKVVFNDVVPTRKIIPNKDVEVCGGIREEPLIVVGPDKGVQNAVVYLVEVAKGKAWPAQGKTPELDNRKCRFEPEVQVIRAGPLDVVNDDPILHNTHVAEPGAANSHGADAARDRAHRLRRARLDGGLDLRGRQPLLRAHRRRWQVQHHRRAARQLQPGGDPIIYRAPSAVGDCRGRQAHESDHRIEEAIGDLAKPAGRILMQRPTNLRGPTKRSREIHKKQAIRREEMPHV